MSLSQNSPKKEILTVTKDLKALRWNHSSQKFNGEFRFFKGRLDLLVYLGLSPKPKHHQATLFRYLNDFESITKTLALTTIDFLIILLSILRRREIYWICHNIDRETTENYPLINSFRRKALTLASSRIFVTDPLLVHHAQDHFPRFSHKKIAWTTFGKEKNYRLNPSSDGRTESSVKAQVQHFRRNLQEQAKSENKTPLIGLCIGERGPKYLHFNYAKQLLEKTKDTDYLVGLIIGGDPQKATQEQKKSTEYLKKSSNVVFFDRRIEFDESELTNCYDFFWRANSDISTPTTVYVAAANHKPILTLDVGFLPELISKYDLGYILDKKMATLEEGLTELINWVPDNEDRFLKERTWDIGARKLIED